MTESKKGRPTPKRRVSESKRQTFAPVVSKEAKKQERALAKAARAAQHAAYMRGEESAMPARDRGPARRFVRDYVDSRRSVGEFFMPVIFAVLILTMIPVSQSSKQGISGASMTQLAAIALMYLMLFIAVIDGLILNRKVKRAVMQKFPGTSVKGLGMYAWLRSTQMRRMRSPRPQKKAGDKI